jgi:flavorubredoxin
MRPTRVTPADRPKLKESQIDEIQDGIYRIAGYIPDYGITFNQFLIKDEKPALIHTGPAPMFPSVQSRVKEVINLDKLRYVILLHFEGDEWGGMRFLNSPDAKLVCSKMSSGIGIQWWDEAPEEHIAAGDGDKLSLGKKRLRFLMTPHVHHWDSMMVFEETQKALFPSDLFLQPGERDPVTNVPALAYGMIERYRKIGIFGSEKPVRNILPRLERLHPKMIHAMHGSSLDSSVHKNFFRVLRTRKFAYRG